MKTNTCIKMALCLTLGATPLLLSAQDWNLSGNSLSGGEFLGSTNGQDVSFRTNSAEMMLLDNSTNRLRIGSSDGFGNIASEASLIVVGNSTSTNDHIVAEFRHDHDESRSAALRIMGARGTSTDAHTAQIQFANFDNNENGSSASLTKTLARISADMEDHNDDLGYLRFSTNSGSAMTNQMFIMSDGDVGIGTIFNVSSQPARKLDVNGNARLRGLPGTTTASATDIVVVDANGDLFTTPSSGLGSDADWYQTVSTTNPATAIGQDIYTLGTVGIGLGAPNTSASLDVLQDAGTSGTNAIYAENSESTSNVGNTLIGIEGLVGSTSHLGGTYIGGRFTAESQRDNYAGYFTASGNSTTGGSWGIYTLADDGSNNVGIESMASDGLSQNTGGLFQATGGGVNATNIGGQFCATGAANNYAIIVPSSCGNVGIGTSTPSSSFIIDIAGAGRITAGTWSSSDRRFKKNINTVEDPLDKITALRGVNYDYRAEAIETRHFPDRKAYGFIAQELQDVMPELVMEDEEGYLSVNYDGVIPVLVEAIKAQQIQIKELEGKMDANSLAAPPNPDNTSDNNQLFQNTPNPANGTTEIRVLLSDQSGSLFMYDAFGHIVLQKDVRAGDSTFSIDTQNMMPGTYVYALFANDGLVDMKKMVVQ